MQDDFTQFFRSAIIRRWKTTANLTALVPAGRIFPPRVADKPTWPYVALESPTLDNFPISGGPANLVDFRGHCYARTEGQGGTTKDGEVEAQKIARQMMLALEDPLTFADTGYTGDPANILVTWERTQVIGEPGSKTDFHGIIDFQAMIVT